MPRCWLYHRFKGWSHPFTDGQDYIPKINAFFEVLILIQSRIARERGLRHNLILVWVFKYPRGKARGVVMKEGSKPSEYAYFLWWAEPAIIKQGTSVRQILDICLLEGVPDMGFKLGTIGPNVSRLLGFLTRVLLTERAFNPSLICYCG